MRIQSVYEAFSDASHHVFRRAIEHAVGHGAVQATHLLRALLEEEPAMVQGLVPTLRGVPEGEPIEGLDSSQRAPARSGRLSTSPSLRRVLRRARAIAVEESPGGAIDPRSLFLAIIEAPSPRVARWCARWRVEASPELARRRRGPEATPQSGSQVDVHALAAGLAQAVALRAGESEPARVRPRVPRPRSSAALGRQGAARRRAGAPAKAPPTLDPEALPTLHEVGRDLVALVRSGVIDEPVARGDLLEALQRVLLCRDRGNALLVGPAGCGKTALVHALAVAIARGAVPDDIARRPLIELRCTALSARTQRMGQLEELLDRIVKEAEQSGAILFVDEAHLLIGVGRTGGSDPLSAGQGLKPALAEGRIRLIGATTPEEFDRFLAPDKALSRRFQMIAVPQPSDRDAIEIIEGTLERYAAHHGLEIPQALAARGVALASLHLPARSLPDSAFQVLDAACASARLEGAERLGEEHLQRAASSLSGVPIGHGPEREEEAILTLRPFLEERLIGQPEATKLIPDALTQAVLGARLHPDRPRGAFLCVGPTGVGKSLVAELLAERLRGSRARLARLDMTEFRTEGAIWGLLGSAPGYVGHAESSGKLARIVREDPAAIILLDEVHRAHETVLGLLLGILDTGRAVDNRGNVLDFHRSILVLTANVTPRDVASKPGFGADPGDVPGASGLPKMEDVFPAELLARLTVVPFRALGVDDLARVASAQVGRLLKSSEALRELDAASLSPSELQEIATRCHTSGLGARCVEAELEAWARRRLLEGLPAAPAGRARAKEALSSGRADES